MNRAHPRQLYPEVIECFLADALPFGIRHVILQCNFESGRHGPPLRFIINLEKASVYPGLAKNALEKFQNVIFISKNIIIKDQDDKQKDDK